MNRSNVRIAVFSAGIVSGLLILLYLPVLIWSPSWGEDGYYNDINVQRFSITSNPLKIAIFSRGTLSLVYYRSNKIKTTNIFFKKEDQKWEALDQNSYLTNGMVLTISTNRLTYAFSNSTTDIATSVAGIDLKDLIMFNGTKITNPFTLWHIKWLEWTAE